jgi:rod shape-determining protein MreC
MPLTGKGTTSRQGIRRGEKHTGGRALIVVVFLSLLLLTLGTREGPAAVLSGARSVFQTVTMPVRYVGSLVTAPFTAASNIMANLTTDQETLSELRAENQRLVARNAELEEAALSTERLEGLLELQSAYKLTSTGARIILGLVDNFHTERRDGKPEYCMDFLYDGELTVKDVLLREKETNEEWESFNEALKKLK